MMWPGRASQRPGKSGWRPSWSPLGRPTSSTAAERLLLKCTKRTQPSRPFGSWELCINTGFSPPHSVIISILVISVPLPYILFDLGLSRVHFGEIQVSLLSPKYCRFPRIWFWRLRLKHGDAISFHPTSSASWRRSGSTSWPWARSGIPPSTISQIKLTPPQTLHQHSEMTSSSIPSCWFVILFIPIFKIWWLLEKIKILELNTNLTLL